MQNAYAREGISHRSIFWWCRDLRSGRTRTDDRWRLCQDHVVFFHYPEHKQKSKMSSKSVKSLFSDTKNGATQKYSYVITISIILKIIKTWDYWRFRYTLRIITRWHTKPGWRNCKNSSHQDLTQNIETH